MVVFDIDQASLGLDFVSTMIIDTYLGLRTLGILTMMDKIGKKSGVLFGAVPK